ncbi:putative nuclease HARBI1 [Cardiocondyla obscurior]|uniref:putative nuclease HARBI1 n=1 Tax=Cardiocondyla obscurior TaxID=286306 RepID=UPI0039657425
MNLAEAIDNAAEVREVNELRPCKPRVFRDKTNPFELYNEREFRQRYRLSKECVHYVVTLVKSRFTPLAIRRNVILPTLLVLITLRYYAKRCYQIKLGDLHGVSQPTVSKIVASVSRVLARLLPEFVVCDAEKRILDIVARWRGSAHDARIWDLCSLKEELEIILLTSGRRKGILLGDSGYPCKPYLLTPILQPQNLPEERYNSSHIRTRIIVERCFGEWKSMFRALRNGMQISLDTAKASTIAMAVLYNIRKKFCDNNAYDADSNEDDDEEDEDDQDVESQEQHGHNHFRQEFVQRHFS